MLRYELFSLRFWMALGLVALSTLATLLSFGLLSQEDQGWVSAAEAGEATSQAIYHVNDARRRSGRRPLRADGALMRAAGKFAETLIEGGILSHTGPDESEFWERAATARYSGMPCGENLGENYQDGKEVVKGWLQSPGHREILLMRNAQEIGVGYARGADGRSVWVMMVGC